MAPHDRSPPGREVQRVAERFGSSPAARRRAPLSLAHGQPAPLLLGRRVCVRVCACGGEKPSGDRPIFSAPVPKGGLGTCVPVASACRSFSWCCGARAPGNTKPRGSKSRPLSFRAAALTLRPRACISLQIFDKTKLCVRKLELVSRVSKNQSNNFERWITRLVRR